MNVIDHGRSDRIPGRISVLAFWADILSHMPGPNELFHQILEALALLCSVVMLFMVGMFLVSIPYGRIRFQECRPPEVG